MNSAKKTEEQLKKELSMKIKGIKTILSQALSFELESDERIELSNMVASSLRAVLYGDKQNGFKSLIHRVGYDKRLLFPIYDFNTSLNIIPTYNVLQFSVNNTGVKVTVSDDLFKTGGMWKSYLTFDSWLNEIVIDTKLQDVEPLSRLLVVKVIADTIGSHVDDNVEKHFYEMSKHDLLPVVVVDGVEVPRDLEAKTKSIFCETIFGIAKELVDSYETWAGLSQKRIGPSNMEVRVQIYNQNNPNSKYDLIKFHAISKEYTVKVNSYNSNSYYECKIFSKIVNKFEVIRNKVRFEIVIIDYKSILGGDYLGKSIYPR